MTAPLINRLEAGEAVAWRMVPVEPTEAMLDEARYFWGPWLDEAKTGRAGRRSDDPADIERARAVWDQMLAASPPPPAVSVEEVARVIDPTAWAILDNHGEDRAVFIGISTAPSVAKATRIIELFRGKA